MEASWGNFIGIALYWSILGLFGTILGLLGGHAWVSSIRAALSWGHLGHFGTILVSGLCLGPFRGFLGQFHRHCPMLGPSWVLWGACWSLLGSCSEAAWDSSIRTVLFWANLDPFGSIFWKPYLGQFHKRCRILGPAWVLFGPSWPLCGTCLGPFCGFLSSPTGNVLSWGHPASNLELLGAMLGPAA